MNRYGLALVVLCAATRAIAADVAPAAPAASETAEVKKVPEINAEKGAEPVAPPPPAPAAAIEAAAPAPLPTTVAPLSDVLAFHEKEIASLKQLMGRWNDKLESIIKRRKVLEEEMDAKRRKADELSAQGSKVSNKEAARLRKDVGRIRKDVAALNKELRGERKVLAAEIRDVAKDAQDLLKATYMQVADQIQKTSD